MGNVISPVVRFFQSEQPAEQKPVTNPPVSSYPTDDFDYDEDYHYTPPPVDINTVYENDKETFLNVLLSLDLVVLRVDISKADKEKTANLVTNHLKAKSMFIHNSSQLPLTYDSLPQYKKYYLSLMFYNGWAQIVGDFFEKDEEKRLEKLPLELKLHSTKIKGQHRLLYLRTQIDKISLTDRKYKTEGNLVLVQVEQSREPTVLANKTKTVLGLVLKYDWKRENDPYRGFNPSRLHSDQKQVEYTVEVFNSSALQMLIQSSGYTLTITPICYIQPILRQVETLSSMCYKTNFKNTFLNPVCSIFATSFEQPYNFKLYGGSATFNNKQKDAIVACFNAVNQQQHLNQTVMIQGNKIC